MKQNIREQNALTTLVGNKIQFLLQLDKNFFLKKQLGYNP